MKTNPSATAKTTHSKKATTARKAPKVERQRVRKAAGPAGGSRDAFPVVARRENTADAAAFIPGPEDTHRRVRDDLAEYLGEGFIQSVTGGDDSEPGGPDAVAPEELGGPFIETDALTEYARSSGTAGASADDYDDQTVPEAFPTAVRADGEPGRTADVAVLLATPSAGEPGEESADAEEEDDEDEDEDDDEDDDEEAEKEKAVAPSPTRQGSKRR